MPFFRERFLADVYQQDPVPSGGSQTLDLLDIIEAIAVRRFDDTNPDTAAECLSQIY